jgi:hypothetical protein
VNNKRLQQARNFKYLGCRISYENWRDIKKKISKFAHIMRILHNTFNANLVQKFQQWKYIMHWPSPFFYMDVKFGTLKKG